MWQSLKKVLTGVINFRYSFSAIITLRDILLTNLCMGVQLCFIIKCIRSIFHRKAVIFFNYIERLYLFSLFAIIAFWRNDKKKQFLMLRSITFYLKKRYKKLKIIVLIFYDCYYVKSFSWCYDTILILLFYIIKTSMI